MKRVAQTIRLRPEHRDLYLRLHSAVRPGVEAALRAPQDLGLHLSVNGVQRQDGHTDDMIFPADHLVPYLSRYMVLEPGDVINTGTSAGVALGLPGTSYLRPGDTVELSVDGLGDQRQTFDQA